MKTGIDLTSMVDSIIENGKIIQRKRQIRELKQRIHNIGNKCGSCEKWMIKDYCKRESFKRVNCNELICDDFQIDSISLDLIQKLTTECEELESDD